MKKLCLPSITFLIIFFVSNAAMAQQEKAPALEQTHHMKTFVIEREIPNAGQLTQEQLQGISQKSCSVLKEMGPKIEWLHSYVTNDKVYCLYKAADIKLIQEHASKGGFPVNSVQELATVINPSTANQD
ncbi:DUF4242 domain-containing protein [Flagellimonas myxillae]|uniref:DUF4242 domain-containing protein n=1 Tax=Flagellimonas myxillae TaxID=2942214 RepID=UPI00201EE358|nr:DUF4242 domain-containing protein [Muricauda myxillae]MCL6267296.1 DUF4242 domain-containing protein [Muricauda myxillae]